MVNFATESGDSGPAFITVNGTLQELHTFDDGRAYVLLNGTVLYLRLAQPYRDSELNELLYVIIVIVFYATALMTLIITQIKRQRREGSEVNYYDEYLQRNSEVKQTCHVVNSKLSGRQIEAQPPPALATAAFKAVAAGAIVGQSSVQADTEAGSCLLPGTAGGGGSCMAGTKVGLSGCGAGRTQYIRDSGALGAGQVLESIPDTEDV